MLQQWRKPVSIALTPEGITINSGSKPSFIAVQAEMLAGPSSWGPVLTELANNTAKIAVRRVKFILSNHYIRYAVLPWQAGIFSQQDWQSLAENHMRILYGDVINSWKTSVAMQGYGQPLVISAIDHLLLEGLEELASQSNWKIDVVEPAFITISNHYHHTIKKNAWLMMIEPQRILLAEIVNDAVVRFSVVFPPIGLETNESIKLLKRELNRQNINVESTVYLFGDHDLLPKLSIENIKSSLLSVNTKTDNTKMGSILAGLT